MINQKFLLNLETEIATGNGTTPPIPVNLPKHEEIALEYCLQNNVRLKQEKILQTFVDQTLAQIASETDH